MYFELKKKNTYTPFQVSFHVYVKEENDIGIIPLYVDIAL